MSPQPLGLFIQPACLQHKYIRHSNSSHIFERPERLRAVLLGVAAAIARIEELDAAIGSGNNGLSSQPSLPSLPSGLTDNSDLSSLLSSLSIASAASSSFVSPQHLDIVPAPAAPRVPGQILQHHPALQLAHSPPPDEGLYEGRTTASSTYLRDLLKWATDAVENIKETGCEIPSGLGLNQGDLYLGPGSVLAIEGAIQTVCQAIDKVCDAVQAKVDAGVPATPPLGSKGSEGNYFAQSEKSQFNKAFCAIRPPGHHCGEDEPSGFCYVNNVVVGALHAYLEHDIDRAIIIDFDLHHGNGTQALVMPLNAATYAEELAVKAGKPSPPVYGKKGKRVRGWKGFYGSVHDIYSYPCEDGDLDLISDASISLAAHGQYIENIHLQPYSSEEDFYKRIYPKYLALLERAKAYMEETQADPDRTIVLISAGFDACEHEHQAMQRHDRRVPVSFFSRYTRDIVAFADKHTEGKIISVLEGGYSDRALTSAAMGHIAGLLDKEGQPHWWSETELNNIEKATKKRRTGKIAPFPAEYASHTHLARTHALLAHFEGTSPDTVAPSTQTTPQHATRMTLRDRRKPALGEEDVTVTPPPARKAVRGKGTGTTPRATPAKTAAKVESESVPSVPQAVWPIKAEPQPAPPPLPQVQPASQPAPGVQATPQVPQAAHSTPPRSPPRRNPEDDLVRSMEGLGTGSLGSLGRVPSFRPDPPSPSSSFSRSPPASPQSPQRRASAISQLASISSLPPISSSILTQMSPPPATKVEDQDAAQQPKIFLRFTRPDAGIPAPQGDLYPALPVSEQQRFAARDGGDGRVVEGGYAYRETSAGLSTESEGEYVSARSEAST